MTAPGDELEPMGELAASVLAAERAHRPRSSDEARERLFGRVLVTVGAGTAIAGATAVGAAGTAKAATGASVGAGAGTGVAVAGASALSTKAVAGIALLAFVAGTGSGAAIHATVTREAATPPPAMASAPPASVAPPEHTASAPPTSDVTPPPSEAPRPSATVAPPVAAVPVPAASAGSATDADLAAERALVDRARTALSHGDTAACMEAVDVHQKRFPRGRLGEERELIAIQALVRQNQTDAAKARAARFRKTYPSSVFRPSIDRLAPP